MCVSKPSTPAPPPPDPNVEIERQNREDAEQAKKAENKAKQLETTVKQKRGGRGSMSLLTGSKGGLGFYDGTL